MTETTYDAIVVGSGITGGWAAKELTERGLRVLLLERGRRLDHRIDYKTETTPPWELPHRGYGDPRLWESDYKIQSQGRYFDEWTYRHFVNDREHPYETTEEQPFQWRRSYNVGGRSLVWGRQTFRMAPVDFEANARDGHGVDWPIRYADLAPWYDHVEEFIGVQGAPEGWASLPDGRFQPAFPLNVVEQSLRDKIKAHYPDRVLTVSRSAHLTQPIGDRGTCQYRGICARGCSYGAYFSSQSSTLPAANATGRLTLLPDSLVESLEYDAVNRRVTGVRVLDTRKRTRTTYPAKLVFLCASTIDSIGVLLRSASDAAPRGLANSSGVLGQYIMDHVGGGSGAAALIPGFEDQTTYGNRPTGIIIPRFRNLGRDGGHPFKRGYVYFGYAFQSSWRVGESAPGLGAGFNEQLRRPGQWLMGLSAHGEALPRAENRVTLSSNAKGPDGLPLMRIEYAHGENERLMMEDAAAEARAMLSLMGGRIVRTTARVGLGGETVHEMGGARMGRDPATSVLNGNNQAHDVPNLFITDGSCMTSSGAVNPSLTYMALTARACAKAADLFKWNAI